MKSKALYVLLYATPFLAGAAVMDYRTFIENSVVPLLVAVVRLFVAAAFLFFLWGIARFIRASGSGDEKGMEEGKNLLVWGSVALLVLVSIWGIILFVSRDLGLGNQLVVPQFRPL